ncbi:ATP-binding protein [Sorangium sp. So ce887]|uniref:ATP-binding protein n=1 Tax=Sorangium sp. So ce887 TaxID=3133324 RepID=UPI003F6333A0
MPNVKPVDPARVLQLASFLQDHQQALIQRWARRVREDPGVPEACRLSVPELIDHIPSLLDQIVDALLRPDVERAGGGARGRAIGSSSVAKEHARSRFVCEYGLDHALRELSLLRAEILEECCSASIALDGDPAQLLHSAIDTAMSTVAVTMAQAASNELRKDAEFRDRIMAILGHDLRDPLSTIHFVASLLQKREDMPEGVSKMLARLTRGADRMTRLINDLLDLTRSRAARGIPINPKPTNLHDLCRQVLNELELLHPERAIVYSRHGDGRGVWDADRLTQVLSNLLSNAIHYSPPGTPVHLALDGQEERVMLAVNNQGTPISPELLPRIFEPFRRGAREVEAQGASGGLGLGLFIARKLVVAHGGTIGVTSDLEHGTTFTVALPRLSQPSSTTPREADPGA